MLIPGLDNLHEHNQHVLSGLTSILRRLLCVCNPFSTHARPVLQFNDILGRGVPGSYALCTGIEPRSHGVFSDFDLSQRTPVHSSPGSHVCSVASWPLAVFARPFIASCCMLGKPVKCHGCGLWSMLGNRTKFDNLKRIQQGFYRACLECRCKFWNVHVLTEASKCALQLS